MTMFGETRLKSIAAALSLVICAASASGDVSAGTNDVWLTDIASLSGDSSWRAMTYETCDGIKGTLLHASWGMDPCKPIRIPLGVRGRHRIFLGLAGTRGAMSSQAPFSALVRLERDPAPVHIGSPANSRTSAGPLPAPVPRSFRSFGRARRQKSGSPLPKVLQGLFSGTPETSFGAIGKRSMHWRREAIRSRQCILSGCWMVMTRPHTPGMWPIEACRVLSQWF